MIKGILYGKSLKQLFFSLLISCFILLGGSFANASSNITAEWFGTVGLESHNSPLNNAFELNFVPGGTIFMNFIGQTFRFFVLKDNTYVFWSQDGRLYAVAPNLQGYFPGFYLCDKMTNGRPGNCGRIENGSNYMDTYSNFFKKVRSGDHFYYNYQYVDVCGGGGCSNVNEMTLCWDSEELNKSICFDYYRCNNNHACNQYNRGGDLIESMGLTYTYSTLPYGLIGYAPGNVIYGNDGSGIDGGDQTNGSYQMTGDLVIDSCTKQKALTWYECQGYTNNLCYSMYGNNTEIFQGKENGPYNDIEVPGKDIMSVYSDTRYLRRRGLTGESMHYNDWFKYWRKSYEVYKQNSDSITNPFIGTPVSLFMYFGQVDAYGLPYTNESIVEYCILSEYQRHMLDQQYTGVASNVVCSLTPIQLVDCSIAIENSDPVYGASGTVGAVGSSWVGITNRTGYTDRPGGSSFPTLQTYNDGKSFENNFFNVLKINFKYPSSTGSPLLPTYIIIALCGLILFRFMSH